MATAKVKKGQKLVCVLCAREVVISNWGISSRSLWCCGKPMKKGKAARKKVARKKPAKTRK